MLAGVIPRVTWRSAFPRDRSDGAKLVRAFSCSATLVPTSLAIRLPFAPRNSWSLRLIAIRVRCCVASLLQLWLADEVVPMMLAPEFGPLSDNHTFVKLEVRS